MNQDEIDTAWSRAIAELSVGTLMLARIVRREDLDRAVEIVAEEILTCLALDDRPERSNWRFKPD